MKFPDTYDHFFHGTFWECPPRIIASANFSESDEDLTYGERESHGQMYGVYSTDTLKDVSQYYAWASNVFGNKCFYGIFFEFVVNVNF